MAFRLDNAIPSLLAVLGELNAHWRAIDGPARQRIRGIIMEHGPQISAASPGAMVVRAEALLQALWAARAGLPRAALLALEAAQGAPARPSNRTSAEEQDAVLRAMVHIADFRSFKRPHELAERVSQLVGEYQARLSDRERAAWVGLDGARRSDSDDRAYLAGVERLLGRYRVVQRLLDTEKSWAEPIGGSAESATSRSLPAPVPLSRAMAHLADVARGTAGPPAPAAAAGAREAAHGGADAMLRYANVHFPATVLMSQQSVPLVVHVAQHYRPRGARVSADDARMALEAGELTIVARAEGFEIVNIVGGKPAQDAVAARIVQVDPDRDCEPVVFFLTPRAAGRKHIGVDFYQSSCNIGAVGFEADVITGAATAGLADIGLEPLSLVMAAEQGRRPVDLELRVALSADRRTLAYSLHSPGRPDYNFLPAGQVRLRSDPGELLQQTLDGFSRLARTEPGSRSPEATARALRQIADIGTHLYHELFPPALKQEYRRFREKYAGRSLLITSDEPWIPWEIVKPAEYDDRARLLYEDPHLCEMYSVSRWLAGPGAPDRALLRRGVLVVPAGNLPAAREEAAYFRQVHRHEWGVNMADGVNTVAAVADSFRSGQTQLYHFACHGNFDAGNPDESLLKLADGNLRPSQLTGEEQRGLRRGRPVVFLNACHSGEAGFTQTRLGGWAQRFLASGASAFVGTLWEINDRLAARFAVEFYDRLWGLEGRSALPLGRAFYEARQVIKALDPANPTWLAYVLYGDPEAAVRLNEDA